MKCRLVVTDVDGTLVDSRQKVVPVNLPAILRFQESGGMFTLATGRTEYSARMLLTNLKVNVPAILYNGGGVFDSSSKSFLFESMLQADTVSAIYEVLKEFEDVNPIFYSNTDQPLVRSVNSVISAYMIKDSVYCRALTGFEQVLEIPVRKVLVIGEPDTLLTMAQRIKNRFSGHVFNYVRSEENYLEFMPPGISKGSALRYLAEYLGIPLDKTVAIGDNVNDRELLQTAGIGVAVANAHEDLKQIADYVSPHTNEQGAVAKAINMFCF